MVYHMVMKRFLLIVTFLVLPLSSFAMTPEAVLKLVNKERKMHNLPVLTVNYKLTISANAKAINMSDQKYFSHSTPNGLPFYWWIQMVGYKYQKAGENLARKFNNEESAHKAFMASPSHKKNILNPIYTEIGIGVKNDIIVEHFGRPLY